MRSSSGSRTKMCSCISVMPRSSGSATVRGRSGPPSPTDPPSPGAADRGRRRAPSGRAIAPGPTATMRPSVSSPSGRASGGTRPGVRDSFGHDARHEERLRQPIVRHRNDHVAALELRVRHDVGDAVDPAHRDPPTREGWRRPRRPSASPSTTGSRRPAPRARGPGPGSPSRSGSSAIVVPADGPEQAPEERRGVGRDADERRRRRTDRRWSAPSCGRCCRPARAPCPSGCTRGGPLPAC